VLCQFADGPFIGLAWDLQLTPPLSGSGKAGLGDESAHHLSVERIAPLGWPPAFSIENGGDICQHKPLATKVANSRQKVLIGAEFVQAGNGAGQPMCGLITAVPMAFDANLFAAVNDFDENSLEQLADNGLTFLLSGALPKRRHISRQEPDRGDLGRAQGLRLLVLEPLVRAFKPGLFGQGLFPLALKRTRDQAVLWLDGIVLPTHPLSLVSGALKTMLPLSLECFSFARKVAGSSYAGFQGCRLQRLQYKLCHQCINRRGLERLTDRLRIITCHANARVTR
jgi:hypothetical protein